MLRRYWGFILAIGLVVFLVSGLAWTLIDTTRSKQIGYEQSAKYNSDNYAKRSDVIIRDRCGSLAGGKKAACVNEERDAARKGQHDERDLEAQRVTAAWTASMGIAAIVGMAASLVGVLLVFITFHETRKANDIAETAHRRQSRAYVAIMGMSLDRKISAGEIPKATVRFKNTGQTPALNVRTSGWMVLQHPDATDMPPDIMTTTGGVTMSGSGGDLNASPSMDRPITEDEHTALHSKNLRLTVFAMCIYEDIFGDTHHLVATGCPKDPVNEVGMSPCDFGNYTSDDQSRKNAQLNHSARLAGRLWPFL